MTDEQVVALARDGARYGRALDMPGMNWEQAGLYLQAYRAEEEWLKRYWDEAVRRWVAAGGRRPMPWIEADMAREGMAPCR